ncbi:ferric iron uptake transcriptional regulator [Nitrosomonadales bacterium]|jgi:Fur family ferric uptake transcriptional regulator|nr:ferric iron uptake transcriptional regulator [Nitrosomonadales bacterium]
MDEHDGLKKTGLKATLPRLKIMDIFEHSKQKHLSAEDIYKLMISSNEEIGLATIYRVLTQFEQVGLLIRHHFEGGKAVYELNEKSHHDHIVCLQCGHVTEFVNEEIEKLQTKVAEEHGFKIIEHSLIIYADSIKKPCDCKK